MKISEEAINAINNTTVRLKIAAALGVGENSVRNYINDNEEDGELTKLKVLNIIREATGMNNKQIISANATA